MVPGTWISEAFEDDCGSQTTKLCVPWALSVDSCRLERRGWAAAAGCGGPGSCVTGLGSDDRSLWDLLPPKQKCMNFPQGEKKDSVLRRWERATVCDGGRCPFRAAAEEQTSDVLRAGARKTIRPPPCLAVRSCTGGRHGVTRSSATLRSGHGHPHVHMGPP